MARENKAAWAAGTARSGRIRVSEKARRTMDGFTFDSMAEMNRYAELRMLERAGVIRDLELQPEFVLQDRFSRRGIRYAKIVYRADFRYMDQDGQEIIEDVKGHETDVYRLKRKLLLYRYPDINFREVRA